MTGAAVRLSSLVPVPSTWQRGEKLAKSLLPSDRWCDPFLQRELKGGQHFPSLHSDPGIPRDRGSTIICSKVILVGSEMYLQPERQGAHERETGGSEPL